MDSDFEELNETIKQSHYSRRKKTLLKLMYSEESKYPFSFHLNLLEDAAIKKALKYKDTSANKAQEAFDEIQLIHEMRKIYKTYLLIS